MVVIFLWGFYHKRRCQKNRTHGPESRVYQISLSRILRFPMIYLPRVGKIPPQNPILWEGSWRITQNRRRSSHSCTHTGSTLGWNKHSCKPTKDRAHSKHGNCRHRLKEDRKRKVPKIWKIWYEGVVGLINRWKKRCCHCHWSLALLDPFQLIQLWSVKQR